MNADPADGTSRRRTVRSFVRRGGRETAAQIRAWAELWPHYGVDYQAQPLDLAKVFARTAPCTLEIGFGDGEHLLERAALEPERNFLGIEVHRSGVGHLLNAAGAQELRNVRVICHDAVEVLQAQLAPGSLDEVQILFPDPWPKARHHKRRLIQTGFMTLLASRLRPGGSLGLATDWAPYAEHMQFVLDACPQFVAVADDSGSPAKRTPTRFERRGVQLGHGVKNFLLIHTPVERNIDVEVPR